MSIIGLFTNDGIAKAIDARNNEGFDIFPISFAASDLKTSPFSALEDITAANAGTWYQANISSRIIVNDHTIKAVCTIPPGATPGVRIIREVYIFAKDSLNNDFILAAGQTTNDTPYDPTGSVTLELQLSLTNTDLTSKFVFAFTQATELGEHNTDPNAHPDLVDAVNKAGLFLRAGGSPFAYSGQNFDEKAEFAGVFASIARGGVTFTADHTGTAWNGLGIVFDGIKTVNAIVTAFNIAHTDTTISHNGSGSEILSAGTSTLTGGTILVANGDLVYRDVDTFYKKALADGSIKSRVAGLADIGLGRRFVRNGGFISRTTGFPAGTDLFLSAVTAGAFSDIPNDVKVGIQIGASFLLLLSTGSSGSGASQGFDAVVTDTPGFHNYPTTQEAITAVTDDSSILVLKRDDLLTELDTQNKRLTFVFDGPETGWARFLGAAETQKINFTAVPTSGTWRIQWNGNQTTDLAYNANAAAVQAAFLLLPGVPVGTTITGNYTSGFTINYATFTDFPEPIFTDPGLNEIQRFNLSPTPPDDGTIRFTYEGDDTVNVAYNDDNTQIELDFEALPDIQDVTVTGGFSAGFIQIEFINQDGKKPLNAITVAANTLTKALTPVTPTFVQVQDGVYPASNLKNGITPIVITAQTLTGGVPVGPAKAITVSADNTLFLGKGQVKNFSQGIDLDGFIGCEIDCYFISTLAPILHAGLAPGVDYHDDRSFGLTRQVVRTVGPFGNYQTLPAAYAAANAGDLIRVLEDQHFSSVQVWNKNLEIECAPEVRLLFDVPLSGALITLGNRIHTRHLHVAVLVNGSYDTVFLFQGAKGHHANLELETNGVGITITNGYLLDSGSSGVFVDGVITKGSATVTNILDNDSGFVSHNVVIRDRDDGTVIDLLNREPPLNEVLVGAVDGVNAVFLLSLPPASDISTVIFVDGIQRTRTVHYNIVNQTVTFTAGNIPKLGQVVEGYYWTTALMATPPSGRAAPFETQEGGTPVVSPTRELNFVSYLSVTQTGPFSARVDVAAGAGNGLWTVEYHTLTAPEVAAKKFAMGQTPLFPTAVMVDHIGNGAQVYTSDFTVINGNEVNWAGLGLDGTISTGDKVRLAYFR